MKYFYLLILYFLSVCATRAQSNTWVKQATHPSTNTNTCIDFPSDSVGYLVNFSGDFCSTADSGKTWTLESSITPKDLFGVDFANDTIGYAVGEDGVIFKTTDGITWNQQTSPTTENLYSVKAINDTIAFAVGWHHTILRTQDGGQNWTQYGVFNGDNYATLWAVDFVNDTLGFAVGKSDQYDGYMYKTTNGGDNWFATGSFQWNILTDIHFIDDTTYYLLSHTINTFPTTRLNIFKTTDAGGSWELNFQDTPGYIETGSAIGPDRFYFNTDSTLFIAGDNGMITKLNVEDSVLTQMNQLLGSVAFKDIVFLDELHGYVVGVGGIILETIDGGMNWFQNSNGLGGGVRAIQATTQTKAHAVGNYTTEFYTNDQGTNWDVKKRGIYHTKDVFFVDSLYGFNVISSGSTSYFYSTTNGGTSWTSQSISGVLNTIVFTDSLNGYLGGDNGLVLKTADGGVSWTDVSTPWTSKIRGSFALSQDTVYFVGDNGLVANTNDGGASYNYYTTGLGISYLDTYFWDADTGYVAGQLNTLLKTTDGGANWTSVSPSMGSDITSIYFMDDQTGFIAGGTNATFSSGASGGGFVHKTTDGGTSWETNQTTSSNGFNTIHFSPEGQGYVGGNNGYIAHAENFSVAIVHEQNVQCTGPNTGSATVQAFNGTPPYSYSWSPTVSSDSAATGLAEGVYVVTVTDALGNSLKERVAIEGPSTYNYAYQSMEVCDSVMWQGNYYSASGIYKDTVVDVSGCDTIKTLTLTVGLSTSSSESMTVCDVYNWNGVNYDSTGTYYDTIANAAGCDSIMTLNLTVNKTFAAISESACYTYTSPSGLYTYSSSGVYVDTISNTLGCDSIITIDLSINSTYANLTETTCNAYTSPSGSTWTTSGNYMDTIPNTLGCDSVISVNLTINTVDVSVNQNGIELEAQNTSANSYQWLDCESNFANISGENGSSFTASQDGEYAVTINENGCTDTSSCYIIQGVGIDNAVDEQFILYPNPTQNNVMLNVTENISVEFITLYDVSGRVIQSYPVGPNSTFEIELPENSGVYFIELTSDAYETSVLKCIKE